VMPGQAFSYDINVKNVSTLGVAYPVTLSDPIPANIKVTGITTASSGFPHWQQCAVTGTDADGYGGTLNCELSAALGVSAAAPVISLAVTVSPNASGGTITNVATATWKNPSIPSEPAKHVSAQAVVTVTTVPPTTLPNTGVAATQMGWLALLLLLGGGLLVMTGTVWRRKPRRH
jgi:large repetitive protein